MNKFILLTLSLCFLSSCASIPVALQVSEETNLTSFAQVRTNADSVKGEEARWGGIIAKVTNNAKNTVLEVVHFPLTSSTRPKQKDQTQGRFRVYYSGLLDPIIYKAGRSITALGQVALMEDGKIGEHEYQYPVIKASAVHLWKEIKQVDVRITHDPFWYTPSFWHYPRSIFHRPIVRNKSTQKKSQSTKDNKQK